MTRHLFAAATLLAATGFIGCSDATDDTASCPAGLACEGAPGGATGTGAVAGNLGGTPGAGGAGGGSLSSVGGDAPGGARGESGGSVSTGGVATGTGGAEGSTLPDRCSVVDGNTARSLVTDGAVLVDVRTAAEYSATHVEGAINVPLNELSSRLDELPTDGPIVVYCQSGSRSSQATTILCEAGLYVLDVGAMSNFPT